VRDVGGEADPLVDARDELVGDVERDLTHPAAAAAHEVEVGRVVGEVVAGRAVVDVGVPHEAELGHGVEGPVHRGRRHGRTAVRADRLRDLLRRAVPEVPDGGEDALALRGQALALSPQAFAEVAHPSNVGRAPARHGGRTYTDDVTQHDLDSLTERIGGGEERPEEARRKNRHGLRRVLIGLLAIVVLLFGGATAFVGYLGYTVSDNVTQEQLLPEKRQPITAPDGKPVAETGTGTNYLVLGADTRPGDAGRSDVIVLVHVPQDAKTIQMIHFPRDLYVSIPGRGKNKINAAYAFGREPLLVETMENLLKVRIHHVVRTDFEGFENMTDAVGGVRVYAEEASNGSGNGGPYVIKKGWNDLNGEQALGFVRERYTLSEGDISRGRRQLAFIKALFLKATAPETITNPVKIAKFTDAATENLVLDQNLTVGDMRDTAISLRNIRSGDIVFATAPFTGFGRSPEGASIDIVDEKGMADLGEAIRTDTMDEYGDVFVTP
jgi:LCP family protein required for cell wall assembly